MESQSPQIQNHVEEASTAYLYFRVNQQLNMTDDQQFCLRWNDFQTNMVASFKHLRDEKSFCDVTIATEVK